MNEKRNEHRCKRKLRKEIMKNFSFEDYIYVDCKNNKHFEYKKFYHILEDVDSTTKMYYVTDVMVHMVRIHIYILLYHMKY